MSKSATEQYQIKKKRKSRRHSSSNNNKSNHSSRLNNGSGSDSRAIHSTVQAAADAATHFSLLLDEKKLHIFALERYKKYLAPEAVIVADDLIDDERQRRRCLRDRLQVQAVENMPLSQGCSAKGALASRRCGSLKPGRVGARDELKRKYNENVARNQRSCNNHNNNSGNNSFNYGRALHQPATASGSAAAHCHKLQHPLLRSALSNDGSNNNLHLSYLFGESLAHCGRLQEAFGVYALAASEQLDGHVPLDRLNTLASSLIAYVQRLSSKQGEDESTAMTLSTDADSADSPQQTYGALESSWKVKFANQSGAAAAWNVAARGEAAAGVFDTLTDGSLELHAPTRQLRVPSPLLSDDYDPLLCPLCHDVLRCPVTANCGHTFCRQCCETITACNICQIKFPKTGLDEFKVESTYGGLQAASATSTVTTALPAMPLASTMSFYSGSSSSRGSNAHLPRRSHAPLPLSSNMSSLLAPRLVAAHTTVTTTTVASTTATATTTMASTSSLAAAAGLPAVGTRDNMKFMPDVLVRRLVEKWWGADLQAKKINETAASYMHLNLLDEALKYCNVSLEKSPTNFKSLLLRAEVLRKLNHCQSSLADVENALKTRYTSAKAHYLRALTLGELGRYDEALYANCLAISLDKSANLSTSELFQHDLAKILQKLLAQSPKRRCLAAHHRNEDACSPYSVLAEHRLRRKQIALLSSANGDHLSAFDEVFDGCGKPYEIMTVEDMLSGGSGGYTNCLDDVGPAYATIAKEYELPLCRQASRKHFRRKGMSQQMDLMPTLALDDVRCSAMFHSVLERTQQEVQRLKKLESSGESPYKQLLQVPAGLIDASDFDCVLCCRTFWKPVVTPCGHTYCWVCLDRCMDYTSSCPLCKSPLVEPNFNMYQGSTSPVPFILAKRPVTKFLEAAMKRFIPESYEKRFRQEMDMEPSVPVFICTTAFPSVPCPLFVYEPRYRLMVRRAVESGEKQFGIVQPHSGKSRYFDVGTILDIRDCVLLGDGCSILSTIGCKRFKILARNEKDGYETAKVEYIYDETISDENVKLVSNMHTSVLSKAVNWFKSLNTELKQEILQSFGEMPPVEHNWESIADGPAWAWWIIALLPLRQQLKVDILATTSLEKRLRAIEKTLDCLSGNFRRAPPNCGVVVCQQQQQQRQQQEQQQQPECDDELTQTFQTDECCLRTTSALSSSAETHSNNGEHSQLML